MLHLSEHVRTTINEEGGVLLDVAQGKILRLNRAGASLLKLLSEGNDEETLASEFSRIFEISLSHARSDVSEFLASLDAHGVLRRNGQGLE